MNEPSTPNSLIEALEMIAAYPRTPADEMSVSTMRGIARAVLADRAQSPSSSTPEVDRLDKITERRAAKASLATTVAGSVDTDEFRELFRAATIGLEYVDHAHSESWRAFVVYLNARLRPAALSGEATQQQRHDDALEKLMASSPTAPVQQAQAVPELAKWIDDAKGKDPFTDDLIAEIERLRAQASANTPEGK